MASAETMSYPQDALDSQQYLSSSLSSLSQSRSTQSLIVRTYKQATQYYLTKRFREALDTLEPIVSPQRSSTTGSDGLAGSVLGNEGEDADSNGRADNGSSHSSRVSGGPAPVAQSSRGTRTKVWVFYLTLLHGIVELGGEEGQTALGGSAGRWKEIASRVREGRIWEEVVARGYGGNEGDVDPDVVVNLSTLLLGHMADQRLNQRRLEAWLAASDAGVVGWGGGGMDGFSTPMSNSSASPKMLATRLKILELYALHVLPANGEWEYAKEFIEVNEVLDEERREAFLHALQTLKEEKDGTAQRERELKEQREREMEQQRKDEEARRAEEARQQQQQRDEEAARRAAAESERQQRAAAAAAATAATVNGKAPAGKQTSSSAAAAARSGAASSRTKKAQPTPPPTFYRRASAMLSQFQHLISSAGRNMSLSSVVVLRLLMFVLAFVVLVARQDVRVKVRRAMEDGWRKVRQTIGMGMKVSYV